MTEPEAYRAPMRSRRDDVPPEPSIRRGLAHGVCGFGGVLDVPPDDVDTAVRMAAAEHDERLARRIARFADVPDGAFAWTRDTDGLFWLGRLRGPWFYDTDPEATAVDLVHVRRCDWQHRPVLPTEAPGAVLATFARGGRNFQRIRDAGVGAASLRIWAR
ncbi:MAG: GAF domain-containing protein [Mycolicibacterium sp.]|nr:GAF domain-containing protein [Mycolicibacterium sp.]